MNYIKINPISKSVIYLKLISETGLEFTTATGFLYKKESNVFLITNKHVITGKDIQNNKLLSKTGAIPYSINAFIPSIEKSSDGNGKSICRWINYEIKLYDENRKQIWREHENFKIDVIAIELKIAEEIKNTLSPLNLNKLYNFPIEVGEDVFIIGYPAGITGGKKLPIWKRGSIASEPDINIDDIPKIIVDASTREGMSGSPVVARFNNMLSGEGGIIPDDEFFGAHDQFIGIYSGRLNSKDEDDFTTQLGIVWKKEVINQILH